MPKEYIQTVTTISSNNEITQRRVYRITNATLWEKLCNFTMSSEFFVEEDPQLTQSSHNQPSLHVKLSSTDLNIR